MKPELSNPSQGKLLVSEPFLKDYYFKRSVILLAEHGDDGSFGLIINKPIDIRINDVFSEFPKFDSKVYLGGPVKPDNLFMLHTVGDKIDGSVEIMKGLYWGGNIDTLKGLIINEEVEPDQFRFFVGYAGWQPKQLDKELQEHSWLVIKPELNQILGASPESLWKSVLMDLGKDYAQWINYPLDPMLN